MVTAVIGLSLQATLGNVVGGLALQVDDSIEEGDWIELENKQQGQVKQIRWRHTATASRACTACGCTSASISVFRRVK